MKRGNRNQALAAVHDSIKPDAFECQSIRLAFSVATFTPEPACPLPQADCGDGGLPAEKIIRQMLSIAYPIYNGKRQNCSQLVDTRYRNALIPYAKPPDLYFSIRRL